MFDWVFRILYKIFRALFGLIDDLMSISLKLVGISDIQIYGEETDFLTYLLRSEDIWFAFVTISVLGFIILLLFAVISIIKAVSQEGAKQTPAQIGLKVFKCMLTFIFVPMVMFTLTWFLNEFMKAVYQATIHNGSSIGAFMFCAFADDAGLTAEAKTKFLNIEEGYYWRVWGDVKSKIEITDFDYFTSYAVGGFLLWNLSSSMLMFVDRAISIVILFIISPFPIAASVLDEGSRFKQWREQVLAKYLTGYAVIIAMNIYCLVCYAITQDGVVFYEGNKTFNNLCKILICMGGGMTMKKSISLIAGLVNQSAAADANDPAFKGNALADAIKKGVGGAASAVKGAVKGAAAIHNFKKDAEKYGVGSTIASRLGFKTEKDYHGAGWTPNQDKEGGGSENQNENKPEFNNGVNINDALENDQGNEEKPEGDNNSNNQKGKPETNKGQNMMNNALENAQNITKGGK